MISKDYWKHFYEQHTFDEPSQFAQFVVSMMKGTLVDLGCGDGRDLYYFIENGMRGYGVDASNEDLFILKQDVSTFIKDNKSPQNVYARFFWHAIDHETQLAILDWVHGKLFIEARTNKDQPKDLFGKHERNLVNPKQLRKDLEERGYEISVFQEGYGMSQYFDEDPHLIRVVATRA